MSFDLGKLVESIVETAPQIIDSIKGNSSKSSGTSQVPQTVGTTVKTGGFNLDGGVLPMLIGALVLLVVILKN